MATTKAMTIAYNAGHRVAAFHDGGEHAGEEREGGTRGEVYAARI